MERRRNVRYLVSKYIGIVYPGGRTVIGRARNAAYKGIFVELDMVDAPAHALVQLLIPVHRRSAKADYRRVPAVITRRARNGVGLRCTTCGNLVLNYARS